MFLQRPLRNSGGTIFGTQYDVGYTTELVNGTKEYYPTVMAQINDVTQHVILPVVLHAPPLFIAAIAANRFTAFCFPLRHAAIWRRRAVIVVTAVLATTCVLLGTAYPAAMMINQAVKCSRATAIQWEKFGCDYSPFSVKKHSVLKFFFWCNFTEDVMAVAKISLVSPPEGDQFMCNLLLNNRLYSSCPPLNKIYMSTVRTRVLPNHHPRPHPGDTSYDKSTVCGDQGIMWRGQKCLCGCNKYGRAHNMGGGVPHPPPPHTVSISNAYSGKGSPV